MFSDWFRPLSYALPRDRFRVVRIRRAGHQDSAPPAGHLSLADHARHAASLLDTLETGAVHWVGHSSSCLIGLELAQDRPGLVASLSLLEPAPGGDLHGQADEQFVAATVHPAMEAYFAGDSRSAFDLFMRGIGGPDYPAVVASQLGSGGLDLARAESAFFFGDELAAVREWVFGPAQAARITQPTLVVQGADSARLTPLVTETVQRVSAWLPDARTHILPDCSHLLPLETADPACPSHHRVHRFHSGGWSPGWCPYLTRQGHTVRVQPSAKPARAAQVSPARGLVTAHR